MSKTFLLIGLLCLSLLASSQSDFFILKKGRRSLQFFKKDSRITFQLRDRQWYSGIITNIRNDSFYVKQEMMRYSIAGVDTLHFGGLEIAFSDVYAMPRKNAIVNAGTSGVHVIYGNQKFIWAKNGLIFQVGGGGYVLLNLINNLIAHDPVFSRTNSTRLAIGTAVFLFGEILHLTFQPFLVMGKKYHLE